MKKNRYLLSKQLVKVVRQAIPRLENLEQVDDLMAQMWRAIDGHVLDPAEGHEIIRLLDARRAEFEQSVI